MSIENSNNLSDNDSVVESAKETSADLQQRMLNEIEKARIASTADESSSFIFANPEENHRSAVRYSVTLPVLLYPVSASKEIDSTVSIQGMVRDINQGGMRVVLDSPALPRKGLELVACVELPNGEVGFCAGVVVDSRQSDGGLSEMSVRFGGFFHGVFLHDMIFPILERNQMRFNLPFPDLTLASLCSLGAANSEVLDRVLVCPRCQSIPTLRYGCSLCLSSNVNSSRMVHHFACAHVDFLERFETPEGLVCEKCRTKNMHVGSDYEYLNGPENCEDCGKSNLEKIQIGHCLSCEHRFPMETAKLLEIVGYRVKRLDILALIDSA